jgi:hypothetical protein
MSEQTEDPTDADPVVPPTIDENPSATGVVADEDELEDD